MEYQNENFGGEYDFRCRFHDGWEMAEHIHEYSELLYCKDGEGRVTVNGQSFSVKAKQFIWIPPNYIHRYDCQSAQTICAVFSNDMIPLFFKALEGRHFCVSVMEAGELFKVFEGLVQLKKDDFFRVSGYLNLILAVAFEQSKLDKGKTLDSALYQKVISYISEHYTENISLSHLSRQLGYNEKYLSYTIHHLTGIHFRRLLSFYRVKHAKRLLVSSPAMSVATIALESGFSAINTFQRTFKEATGMSPLDYRRKYTTTGKL